ncbi:hypothetical protein [Streptomyces sp. NPDC005017]|uniref:hypothetical protein n=1 Tax=Streptomyces sp. NPDC005017 TaxID=3364706 RepID=UPI0036B3C0C7
MLTDDAGLAVVTGQRGEYTGVVHRETLMNSVRELLEADRLEALGHQHELEEPPSGRTHAEGDKGEKKA